jgi:serine/threonine-protein kinase HipA
MAKNTLIDLFCFDQEIGRIGYDENSKKSFFQYNPAFLKSGAYTNLFPTIFKRTETTQVFSEYNSDSFKGLPPMIADSLPDIFGNIVFEAWLESSHEDFKKISVIEQLAYVANRGMGALEYRPGFKTSKDATIDIDEIVEVLKLVLENKQNTTEARLDGKALLNVFKIGTSAGGARPKIVVSENKETGAIIPGDLEYSDKFNHYLVKLNMGDEEGYNREVVEYCYYLTATGTGITMMPSKLIEDKHFATLRFDRQNGMKKHVLTASGLSGWDYKDPANSSYENLFELASYLKIPYRQLDELFRRMVFNIVFGNTDDHLKNHSFIYDENEDKWDLAPAYDLTYALNPFIKFMRVSRVLAVNNKRAEITVPDILTIAEKYTIKNPKGIIDEVQEAKALWLKNAQELNIPDRVVKAISKEFLTL